MRIKDVMENFVREGVRRPRRASSVSVLRIEDMDVLKSYDTVLMVRSQDGKIALNEKRYSVTTSRQQGTARYLLHRAGYRETPYLIPTTIPDRDGEPTELRVYVN